MSQEIAGPATPPRRVFISYSHDSDEHVQRVLALADSLRLDGIDARLDQYDDGAPTRDLPSWMEEQIESARFIVVVCTETYTRRFQQRETPGQGLGVRWEGAILRQELYAAEGANERILPVVFGDADRKHVPKILRSWPCYDLAQKAGYTALLRRLTDQPPAPPPPLGTMPWIPGRRRNLLGALPWHAPALRPKVAAAHFPLLPAAFLAVISVLAIAVIFMQPRRWSNAEHALAGLPADTLWLTIGLTIAAATLILLRRRDWRASAASRLTDPELFDLERSSCLVGRDSYARAVADACTSWPVVWLVGASGAGKTAFLQYGVRRLLLERPGFIPIYLDMRVGDWGQGESERTWQGIATTVIDTPQGRASVEPHRSTDTLDAWLRHARSAGELPILLFDQFDDYQLTHAQRFLKIEAGTPTVLLPHELCQSNPYWAVVANLVRDRVVHCLFACRDDNLSLLQSVRFVEPKQKPLPSLSVESVRILLDDLTRHDTAIEAPDRGWTDLKALLLRDLVRSDGGGILPMQLAVALGVIRHMPLAPKSYYASGALRGLERLHVRQQVSRVSGLVPEVILESFLLQMIDGDLRKTRPVTENELYRNLPVASTAACARARQALEYLSDQHIIRAGPAAEGRPTWQLYHDYLCHGLLDERVEMRLWKDRLADAEERFHERGPGPIAWWSALLPSTLQIRFLRQRLNRRFTYGSARVYALQSLVRLAVEVILPALLVGGLLLRLSLDNRAQREAGDIVAAFDFDATLNAPEVHALEQCLLSRICGRLRAVAGLQGCDTAPLPRP